MKTIKMSSDSMSYDEIEPDLPIESYLEQFCSQVKKYSKDGGRPAKGLYQVVGDYQQKWLQAYALRRYNKDVTELNCDELCTLMNYESFQEIELRAGRWIQDHAFEVFQFM